jgi:2-hydroxyacyl-CoA lyase 1
MSLTLVAQCAYPDKKVVAVVGDSAFGFRFVTSVLWGLMVSAMEIETAVRSKLPILVYVINNNGIYHGLDAKAYQASSPLPSTALSPDTRYDQIAEVISLW